MNNLSNQICLYDEESGIVIDSAIYLQIVTYIREMFNINPTNRKKIKVNGIINYAVSEHEINVITQSVNTKISYKNIVPANK